MDKYQYTNHPCLRCHPTKLILISAIICLLHLFNLATSQTQNPSPDGFHRNGHLQPLGSHAIKHPIQSLDRFPTPQEFFTNYVYPSIPVVFKNGARRSPAFSKWTDEYLLNLPESAETQVSVEAKKVEDRTLPSSSISFAEFVGRYKQRDEYLVTDVPDFLKKDVLLPPPLLCDDILNHMADMVLWFSNGGTKSVVHNDDVDNINCLFSGTKELLFMNITKYRNQIVFDHPEGSYMSTNIESVDFDKYPQFEDAEFHSASLSAGDCLFIPYKWIHQVNSIDRNIAVNVWWEHRTDYAPSPDSCGTPSPDMSLADITLHAETQELMDEPLKRLVWYMEKGGANEADFMEFVKTIDEFHGIVWVEESLITAKGVFNLADMNKDGQLTQQDLQELKDDEQTSLLVEQQLTMLWDVKLEQESKRQLEVMKKLEQSVQQPDKDEL